jgi:hypothetical protein
MHALTIGVREREAGGEGREGGREGERASKRARAREIVLCENVYCFLDGHLRGVSRQVHE